MVGFLVALSLQDQLTKGSPPKTNKRRETDPTAIIPALDFFQRSSKMIALAGPVKKGCGRFAVIALLELQRHQAKKDVQSKQRPLE